MLSTHVGAEIHGWCAAECTVACVAAAATTSRRPRAKAVTYEYMHSVRRGEMRASVSYYIENCGLVTRYDYGDPRCDRDRGAGRAAFNWTFLRKWLD